MAKAKTKKMSEPPRFSEALLVRITPEEMDAIKTYASKKGETISSFVRRLCRRATGLNT